MIALNVPKIPACGLRPVRNFRDTPHGNFVSTKKQAQKTAVKKYREGFKYNCPHHYKPDTKFTIFLDWLQLTLTSLIGEADLMDEMVAGAYHLQKTITGTTHFKYRYEVYRDGVKYFDLQLIPRNNQTHEAQTCVLKFENWLLYEDWFNIYRDFIKACYTDFSFTFKKISQIHIAIDGLNYLPHLMNDYIKGRYDIKLIGKTKINANTFNRSKRIFEGFTFGSPKGDKVMSIYNKSRDIERTNKRYIEDKHKQKFGKNIETYRVEMRLKNSFLKRIQVPNSEGNLQTLSPYETLINLRFSDFLLNIFNSAAKNFFEWVVLDDKNITRCTRIAVFPKVIPGWHLETKYREIYIEQRRVNETAYKAKMTLHETFKLCLHGSLHVTLAVNTIQRICYEYRLFDYYERKKDHWLKKHKTIFDREKHLTEDQKERRLSILMSPTLFVQYQKDDESLYFKNVN